MQGASPSEGTPEESKREMVTKWEFSTRSIKDKILRRYAQEDLGGK
ncbi:MAG: hypothetical protein WD597_09090 [Balneolaceae bacterium]